MSIDHNPLILHVAFITPSYRSKRRTCEFETASIFPWFAEMTILCSVTSKTFGPPTSAHHTGTGSKDHTPPDLMTPSRVRIGVCLYWRSDATPGQCATPLLIPTKRAHCGGSGSWENYLQLCISATTSPKYSPFWIDWLRGEMMTQNLPQGTQPLAYGTFRWPITTKQAMHNTKQWTISHHLMRIPLHSKCDHGSCWFQSGNQLPRGVGRAITVTGTGKGETWRFVFT